MEDHRTGDFMSGSAPGCLVCAANSGARRISPGRTIHFGRWWQVEHAYPTSLLGWLVIVLRRHAEALHDLTPEEASELGELQRVAALALRSEFGTLKEYSVCFGELEGFSHIHVHLVPRAPDLDTQFRGTRAFGFLKPRDNALPPELVAARCDSLALRFTDLLDPRFLKPPETLDTERLHFRRLVASDARVIFERWAQDTDVTRYLVWRPHAAISESVAHAERCEKAWTEGAEFTWILEDRRSGAVVGSIAAHPEEHRVALGYLTAPTEWGKGYMTEAAAALATWFLEQPEVHRVWAVCDVDNRASARVLEKAGFIFEGTLRRWIMHPNVSDEPRDVLCYARVR